MSLRAKCPTCGRKQTLDPGDVGEMILCSACGNRFLANVISNKEIEPAEIAVPESPPIELPATVEPPYIQPNEAPAVPSPTKWILPVAGTLVFLTAVAIVLGIYTFSSWFHDYGQLTNATTAPVLTAIHADPATKPATDFSDDDQPVPPILPSPSPVKPVQQVPQKLPTIALPSIAQNTLPDAAKFHPVQPPAGTAADLDDKIGNSIKQGVDFLLTQFVNGKLKDYNKANPETAGMDALAVYALLHAAEATHDLRLIPNSPLVSQMLEELKTIPMDRDFATYSRSLRTAALGVYHRAEDTPAMRADAYWLTKESVDGAFTYPYPSYPELPWDNSNSQYGALGVWAAMDAGVEVPNSFWVSVQKHWLGCQLPDGEWSYTGYGGMGELSMTVAGITTLLIAEDQLNAKSVVNNLGHPPFNPALAHAITWLEAGDNSVSLPETWRTYNLFGLERAALASGFKYFGRHDWYRELAPQQMNLQADDGSWSGESPPVVETSYTLLFLSRGRHPIFMNKLRFDGHWSNRPRDISNLTHFADGVLERPLNWQVVSLKSDWSDWMDSPVLYIASHEPLNFTDSDCEKLRNFAENGGLIFTHADGDSAVFNKSIVELSHRIFPEFTLADLLPTHPIYSTVYHINPAIRLQGISNGSRLLLVNSPTDLNKSWQQRDSAGHPAPFQMGINIFIYAAGKADLRNKLKTPVVPDPRVTPVLTTAIAQIRHLGDWDPEPAGLPRFARLFQGRTSVKVNVVDADPEELNPQVMPVAHLTGSGVVHFEASELKSIHNYVENGGVLLIDSCGASPEFNQSLQMDFLPHAFPKSAFTDMRNDDPIQAGNGDGMIPLTLRLRPYRRELDGSATQPIQYFNEGKGMVIFSPIDLSTALLGTNTWAINGYEPQTAYELVHNVMLYALEK